MRRALFLLPHTDDEIACAGYMLRLIEAAYEVHVVTLSDCKESTPEGYDLGREHREALQVIGVDQADVLDFPVRHFPEHRSMIRDRLYRYAQEAWDVVVGPAETDRHQDHEVVSREMMRVFRRHAVVGWAMPWNAPAARLNFFVPLTEDQVDRKVAAMRCYGSQVVKGRIYFQDGYVRAWAQSVGARCGVPYAEGYEMIRWVI